MDDSLYIFVTSERPDQYLNSIAHCLIRDGLRHVVFVNIRGFAKDTFNPAATEKGISLAALRNVILLLDSLSSGFYRFFIGDRAGESVDLKQFYSESELGALKSIYKQILDASSKWEHQDIHYSELRNALAQISTGKNSSRFDVTAVRKTFLGDLVACCLLEGIKGLYTFDLKIRPNFDDPWKMLFHKLNMDKYEDSLYQYTNIVKTPIFEACSKSVLIKSTSIKAVLFVAIILLIALIVLNFFFKQLNWLVEAAFITSALASIISLWLIFFPPKGR